MESDRFDRLAKALGLAVTRRAALAALLGGVLPEAGAAAGLHRRRKRRDRRKRRAERPGEAAQTRSLPPLKPSGPTLPIVPGGTISPGLPPDRICRAICPGCCVGPEGADCVTCANPTPICGNRACVACANEQECLAAGRGNLCCNGSCESGLCCASADCVDPTPICAHHICAACASGAQCAAAGKGTLCCAGACIPANDPNNCGACGHVCSGNTPACFNGACTYYHVCPSGCPFSDLQSAVSAASAGSTIRIGPGIYSGPNGRVTIDKPLTLTGEGSGDDPTTNTILDGAGSGRVVSVTTTGPVTLQGLRIAGGAAALDGGGVYNDGGALTLLDCAVSDNHAIYNHEGGGIFNSYGALTLIGCTLSGNSAMGGGAISNDHGTVNLTGCAVAGNDGGVYGGGIVTWGGMLTLTDSTITGNSTNSANLIFTYDDRGGAIANYFGMLQMTGCAVADNVANDRGGGLANKGTATLVDCIFQRNDAGGDQRSSGGAIWTCCGTMEMTGCTVRQNRARRGGGIHTASTLHLTSSRVSENAAASAGGGIFLEYDGSVVLDTGSVVVDNSAGQFGGGVYNPTYQNGQGRVRCLDMTSRVCRNTPDDCHFSCGATCTFCRNFGELPGPGDGGPPNPP